MRLLVIGGSKGIGLRTVEAGLGRGHNVRAMARGAEGMALDHEGLEKFPGDALSSDDVARALDGVDVVISALGIRERLAMVWEDETLFSAATDILIPAMETAGVKRLIVVTGFGAGDSRDAMSWPERMGHGAVLGKVYADKTRQEARVMESSLDWTIARPVILRNTGKVGKYRILTDPAQWRNGLIDRAEVADFLVTEAEVGNHIHDAVVLAR